MGGSTAPLELTSSDLEMSSLKGHSDFKALYFVMQPSWGICY